MMKDMILKQFRFNRWATQQVLDTAEALTRDEFVAPDDSPFGSIRNTLVHIVETQQGWVWVMEGRGLGDSPVDPEDFPDVASVRSMWNLVESQTEAFLETMSEDDLPKIVSAEFDWGNMTAPTWEILLHLIVHNTQHRSEAAVTLSKLGHSPGMLDFLFFAVAGEYEYAESDESAELQGASVSG